MYKPFCFRVLSKLCANKSSTSLYSYALSSKPREVCFHTNSTVNNETNPKKYRNELIELSEDRNLPQTMKCRKYLPFTFLQKRWDKLQCEEAILYLYEDLCQDVDWMQFFIDFKMSDTFSSWFMVMELHIYMLCCRIMKEGNEVGIPIRDTLTDIFWKDVQFRAELLGIPESVRVRQLKMLSNQFQAAFYGYDEGVQANDIILAAIVWRRFLSFECDDVAEIERLVKYIRFQLEVLHEDSLDEILYKRRKLFIPLQDVTL